MSASAAPEPTPVTVQVSLDQPRHTLRGGFGASTTPFPDNRYAFNYPVKQSNSYSPPNSYSVTPYNMTSGFPAPTYRLLFEAWRAPQAGADGEWLLTCQTYPIVNFRRGDKLRFADDRARLFIMRSKDLVTWGQPELIKVKGPDVP